MPSLSEEEYIDAQDDSAAAVPADVAEGMRQFVQALTTPESDLAQQVAEEVQRWAARYEQLGPAALAAGGATSSDSRCLAGSSISNSRCSSPRWSGASAFAVEAANGARLQNDATVSGRSSSSEEGSSTAWRLCGFMQRAGWPVQHCASYRSGGGGAGSGGGWRFASGHEFLLLHPYQCRRGRTGNGGSQPAISSGSSGSGDADMADVTSALVLDPEFSTQFNLASPTPRYQVVLSLLPRVFVGSYDRLQRLVEWVCREMQGSFQGSGNGPLPPWRSLDQVLNKWRVQGGEDGCDSCATGESHAELRDLLQQQMPAAQQAKQQAAPGSWLPQSPAGQEHGAAAFSVEQQQAMRSLLLQSPASHPQLHLQSQPPLTSSSSCSSMDVVPSLPAAPALPTPRSLLTQELSELAAAGSKRCQQQMPVQQQEQQQPQQGPAAAILSMMMGRGGGTEQ